MADTWQDIGDLSEALALTDTVLVRNISNTAAAAAGTVEEAEFQDLVTLLSAIYAPIANASFTGTFAVPAGSISYAEIQDVSATDRLLGRSTAGAGDIEEIACTATARSILDDASTAAVLTTIGALPLAGGTLTGALVLGSGASVDGGGKEIAHHLLRVVTGVTGALTTAAHSGNALVTSGNVTVPTTTGFHCTLIAGGAHTITFNATVSAAMAAGDVVSLIVQSPTVIRAVKVLAANLVAFA